MYKKDKNSKRVEDTWAWRATCRFRDYDGVTRSYSKFGPTKAKAENALLMAMRTRQDHGRQVAENPTLSEVAKRWLASVEVPEVVVDATGNAVSPPTEGIRRQTWDQYAGLVRRLIEPKLGALKVNEIRTSTCDSFLRSLVVDGRGYTNARLAKTVLNQILSYAIRHDLYTDSNPVHDVDRMVRPKKIPKGLTAATLEEVREAVAVWRRKPGVSGPRPTSVLADIVEVLLGTGVRIGEVLAIRWQDVDLDGDVGKVAITGTLVEPRKGPKFRQEYPKNPGSERILPVPRFVVDVLLRRSIDSPASNSADAVFWPRNGTYMQASSVRRSLRSALKASGLDDSVVVTPHAFRRTVATLLAREETDGAAAEMLGHSNVAMTHAAYIQRLKEVADYTHILNRLAPAVQRES
ncbi:site-specific integrase [Sinomonas atrocyanea]|nr:site-specific integrase [Sinomonas atrocyanea]MDR6623424.1 integrase [Sinomonas atrocyanea]